MPRKKKAPPNPKDPEMTDPRDEYLSRFVKDKMGKDLGESIGLDGERLIIKDRMDFYRIPLKSVVLMDDHIRITGRVNWKKARKEGDKWRTSELDPLYGGDE